MKKLFIVAAILASTTAVMAQSNTAVSKKTAEKAKSHEEKEEKDKSINVKKVPALVKDAFGKQYPEATEIAWESKGANYEAEFKNGGINHEAVYTPAGALVKKVKVLSPNDMTPQLREGLSRDYYGGVDIKEMELVEPASGAAYYKVAFVYKDAKDKAKYSLDGIKIVNK